MHFVHNTLSKEVKDRRTGQDSGQAWSVRVGCPMDVHRRPLDRWTGRDSGTCLVSEGGMSIDISWMPIGGGLDGTVG